MTEEELKKLRGYYHALLGIKQVFEDAADEATIGSASVGELNHEIDQIEADFPGFLPTFSTRDFVAHRGQSDTYYHVAGVRSFIARALARLKVAIDTPESTPVTQTREFSFVRDQELRKVLERDYSEIQRAYIAKCWKSVIILSGGEIEAMLVDVLLQNPGIAKTATKAPSKPDITKWDLADLINVCVELKLVSPGVEKLSHSIREYRNLVHPGNEIRNKLTFDAEEARIALEVLHIMHRDLST